MKNKKFLLVAVILAVVAVVLVHLLLTAVDLSSQTLQTQSVAVQSVGQEISANGSVHSENEVTLHFQMGGKLVYLPFKQGDAISIGQTIAMLDTSSIQKTIQSAMDAYQSQKISYDVVNDFNGDRSLADTGLSVDARRQLETAANTLDQASLAVAIQQVAEQQATLTSPITGIVTQEDVTVPGVNVTPTTSFSVADPSMPVFQSFVLAQDIDFVTLGATANITIDGLPNTTIHGTVEKIYPQSVTSSDGSQVYQVDITADALKNVAKLGQTGTVLIESNAKQIASLVPAWTIVGHNYVWVNENGKSVLKKITEGDTYNNMTEVVGLSSNDKIILNPRSIAAKHYTLL